MAKATKIIDILSHQLSGIFWFSIYLFMFSSLDMIIMSKFSNKPVSTEYRNLMPRSRIYKKIENLKKVPYLEVYELKEAWQLVAE